MRHRVGGWLRKFADHISPDTGPRSTNMSFTFDERRGIVIHHDERGCRLWYMAEDYERAHGEAKR